MTAPPGLPLLDLARPARELTAALVDVPSVSGDEARIADLVEAALRTLPHVSVERDGDAVLARTDLGRPTRLVLAGHLDTVPIAGNVPSREADGVLYGCGSTDMKSGVAVLLRVAALATRPAHDLTFVCYEAEEVEAARNGLGRLARTRPGDLRGDLALLLEPTDARVEAGCQGVLRVVVRVPGRRAHAARGWLGENAIHRTGELLARLAAYEARTVEIDGCVYREGLNAVRIRGGVAGNVIPDECSVEVAYRFAPDRTEEEAVRHVEEVLAPYPVEVVDSSPGAPPGLGAPLAREFVAAVGSEPVAKYGWTDVARFAALGIPALNYGPGDPNLAHTRDESVRLDRVDECERVLLAFVQPAASPG